MVLPFNVISKRCIPVNVIYRKNNLNSASKMANCIIVDIVKYLMLLLTNS